MKKTVLVTGGAGYIGSHTVVELLNKDYNVIVCDNFCNSSKKSIDRIEQITSKSVRLYDIDVRNKEALSIVFKENKIDSVIHFAGLKAVGESVSIPLKYYDNNLNSTLVLLEVMKENNIKNIIFSSSATVYGNPDKLPINEESSFSTTNPYGATKLIIEGILKDLYRSDNSWEIVILRYFNPIGAHESGLIGEDPNGIPNNLVPYIAQVAIGKLKEIRVFGNDYNTKDGTGVRDYIHVVDLALGHICALEKINSSGIYIYNLGTGMGYSVLEVIKAFEKACGKKLPYVIAPRRPGDIDACYASNKKAKEEIGFIAKRSIEEMCASSWKWQINNPKGYE